MQIEEHVAQGNLHKLFHSTARVMRSSNTDPWICYSCHCILIICQEKRKWKLGKNSGPETNSILEKMSNYITSRIELNARSTNMRNWGNCAFIVLEGIEGTVQEDG